MCLDPSVSCVSPQAACKLSTPSTSQLWVCTGHMSCACSTVQAQAQRLAKVAHTATQTHFKISLHLKSRSARCVTQVAVSSWQGIMIDGFMLVDTRRTAEAG